MADPLTFMIAGAASCALAHTDAIELPRRALHIGDVVSLDCITPGSREHIAAVEIARLAPRAASYRLSRAAIAVLVRRRLPALDQLDLNGPETALITLAAPASRPTASSARDCYVAARLIATGDTLDAAAVEHAPCEPQTDRAPLRYDRVHRVTRAARDIGEGEFLGALERPPAFVVDRGAELVLSVHAGSVAISRTVVAVAPSAGDAVLVQTEDGEVFSAPAPDRHRR